MIWIMPDVARPWSHYSINGMIGAGNFRYTVAGYWWMLQDHDHITVFRLDVNMLQYTWCRYITVVHCTHRNDSIDQSYVLCLKGSIKWRPSFANHNNGSQNNVSQMSSLPHILHHNFLLFDICPTFYLYFMPYTEK